MRLWEFLPEKIDLACSPLDMLLLAFQGTFSFFRFHAQHARTLLSVPVNVQGQVGTLKKAQSVYIKIDFNGQPRKTTPSGSNWPFKVSKWTNFNECIQTKKLKAEICSFFC